MPDDTPTAHLVLTVPPAIAAAWERLEPEAQVYWSRLIVHGWLRYILEPPQAVLMPYRPAGIEAISQMTIAELSAFVHAMERKYAVQASSKEPPHA